MSEFLSLRNLTISFDEKPIVNNFNFSLEKGDIAVLKGPSGLGKSTILNVIMGFIKPDKGAVFVDGVELDRHSVDIVRSKICWLPQNPSIIGTGNVLELIYKPFEYHQNKKIKPELINIQSALEELGLENSILNQNYEDLSGGEKQRIGILLCKLLDRKLLLLDEPVASLDKDSIDRTVIFIMKGDVTILSTSHDENWSSHCNKQYDFLKIREGNNAGI